MENCHYNTRRPFQVECTIKYTVPNLTTTHSKWLQIQWQTKTCNMAAPNKK